MTITGNVRMIEAGGDGVNVKIMKNGTKVWPTSEDWQSIAGNDTTTGVNHNFQVSVAQDDIIYFVVDENSGGAYDTTIWDPTISY